MTPSSLSFGATSTTVVSGPSRWKASRITLPNLVALSLPVWRTEKLCPSKAIQPACADCRHVGILSVQGDKFQIAEIPLKTVRPFEIDELDLVEEAERDGSKVNLEDKDTITACLREKVSSQRQC